MIAHSLLQNPQWPKAMRHTFTCEGKVTTPFRQLIRKMPGNSDLCKRTYIITEHITIVSIDLRHCTVYTKQVYFEPSKLS